MTSLRLLTVACAALTLTLLGVDPVIAQDEPAEGLATETEFVEQVSVDIVNVEVFVTDKDDNPVTGLSREDFLVFEDDRPVEVVNFYKVEEGQPIVESQLAPEPEAALEMGPQPVKIPESQRLHLIVFIDNNHIHPLNRNRVFKRLREFLRNTVQPGDEVMVASYDRSLHIRQPFTENPESANRALFELEEVSGYSMQREEDREQALKAIYESSSVREGLSEAKRFADEAYFSLMSSLDGLRELLASLAGLPGRKMFVHVSDGLPMVPGQDLYQAVQQRFADISVLGEGQSRDASRDFMRLITEANSARISLYTIDAGGLRTQTGMGADVSAMNTPYVMGNAVDAVRTSNLQDTLILLADRTGGQAVFNTNDVRQGLSRFATDVTNYYSLGYRAPIEKRGRYHRIRVELKEPRRGWRVRHREGYRDKSIEIQMADAAEAFLVHGFVTNPLDVSFGISRQNENDDGMVEVSIDVLVPIGGLVLLPRPGFHEGRIRLYFAAVDEKGREAPLTELPFELRIPDSAIEVARGDALIRTIDATMRPGPHKVVIGVRDEFGDQRSIIGGRLTVDMPSG